jgi:hypothetical protein
MRFYLRHPYYDLGALQQKCSIDDHFKRSIVDEDNEIVYCTISALTQDPCHISRLWAEQKSGPLSYRKQCLVLNVTYVRQLATIRLISILAEVRDSTLTQDIPTVNRTRLGGRTETPSPKLPQTVYRMLDTWQG